MQYYKCLLKDRRSVHGYNGADGLNYWPPPEFNQTTKVWTPGAWKTGVGKKLKPHFGGLHLAPENMLIHWLQPEIYLADMRGEKQESIDCTVAWEAHLLKRVYIPRDKAIAPALSFGQLAYETFGALIFEWDIVLRLEKALEAARKGSPVPADWESARVWKEAAEVVDLCETDKYSGFETNINVEAAEYAARAILLLNDLDRTGGPDHKNWLVLKKQAAYLTRALSLLVEDILLRKGAEFNVDQLPEVVRPFLKENDRFPLLHHSVRFNVSQHCNEKLLAILEDFTH